MYIENKSEDISSPEKQAEEELLGLGIQTVPENIRTVIELQRTKQHPAGYEDIVNDDSLENVAEAMKDKNISHVIHAEDPSLWIHCKLAMKLAEFLPVSDEKKADLKLIMLYHDLGKTTHGLSQRYDIRAIQTKELARGKLYQVAKGHALERQMDTKARLKANGITGEKLKMFMMIIQNHMETQLSEMSGERLVKLFDSFGDNEDERKETANMLAWAVQVDGNATAHLQFDERGELASLKKENTTGRDFEKIWEKYLSSKK